VFASGKPFQSSLMFVGKARSLPYRSITWVGSCLTHKHYTSLERLTGDKRTSLLRTFRKFRRKKFYKIFTRIVSDDPAQFSEQRPENLVDDFHPFAHLADVGENVVGEKLDLT
jgi:hypothetical protein